MTKDDLIASLNRLGGLTESQIAAVARSRNASLDARLAAILLLVGMSPLDISATVVELVCDLTDPEWRQDAGSPIDTDLGRVVTRILQTKPLEPEDRDQLPSIEAIAWRLMRLAKLSATVNDDSLDLGLRMLSGKDSTWWLEWIRSQEG